MVSLDPRPLPSFLWNSPGSLPFAPISYMYFVLKYLLLIKIHEYNFLTVKRRSEGCSSSASDIEYMCI